MNRFILKIDPEYKEQLKHNGNIIFDSKIIDGLIGFETKLSYGEVSRLSYVYIVECDRTGTYNV